MVLVLLITQLHNGFQGVIPNFNDLNMTQSILFLTRPWECDCILIAPIHQDVVDSILS